MREPSDWPFADPPNVACFTTRGVLEGSEPIFYVYHDLEEGAWQFHSTSDPAIDDARVLTLSEACDLEPRLYELADLPVGWCAWRGDLQGEWIREPSPTLKESSPIEVAVRLLDEGVDVWRMVSARHMGGDLYQISPQEQPCETETWEFHPGDLVHCVRKKLSDGEALVAVRMLIAGFVIMLWTYFGVNLLLPGLHAYA